MKSILLPCHGIPCTCRHSSGSIAKLTRRLTSMSEGHSMEVDAVQPVPQSDALIDGFTLPQVRLHYRRFHAVCFHLHDVLSPA